MQRVMDRLSALEAHQPSRNSHRMVHLEQQVQFLAQQNARLQVDHNSLSEEHAALQERVAAQQQQKQMSAPAMPPPDHDCEGSQSTGDFMQLQQEQAALQAALLGLKSRWQADRDANQQRHSATASALHDLQEQCARLAQQPMQANADSTLAPEDLLHELQSQVHSVSAEVAAVQQLSGASAAELASQMQDVHQQLASMQQQLAAHPSAIPATTSGRDEQGAQPDAGQPSFGDDDHAASVAALSQKVEALQEQLAVQCPAHSALQQGEAGGQLKQQLQELHYDVQALQAQMDACATDVAELKAGVALADADARASMHFSEVSLSRRSASDHVVRASGVLTMAAEPMVQLPATSSAHSVSAEGSFAAEASQRALPLEAVRSSSDAPSHLPAVVQHLEDRFNRLAAEQEQLSQAQEDMLAATAEAQTASDAAVQQVLLACHHYQPGRRRLECRDAELFDPPHACDASTTSQTVIQHSSTQCWHGVCRCNKI